MAEGREEKGRPPIEEDGGRCFAGCGPQPPKGGASAVGGGEGRKVETGNLRPERIRLPCTRALTEELAGPH